MPTKVKSSELSVHSSQNSSQFRVDSSQTKQDSEASVNREQRTENRLSVNSEPETDNYSSVNRELVNQNRRLWRHGFTLIELLIVISIIAILVASATASWQNAQMKGRDGKRKSDLKAVQQALETYIQTYGRYPSSSSGVITCSGDEAGSGSNPWGSSFRCPQIGSVITFMQQLPQDPAYQTASGYYYANTTSFSYTLSALLENTRDPDIPPQTTLPCILQSGRNYCVTNP